MPAWVLSITVLAFPAVKEVQLLAHVLHMCILKAHILYINSNQQPRLWPFSSRAHLIGKIVRC